MKRKGLIALAALALASCGKPVAEQAPEPTAEPRITPATPPPGTPSPEPVAAAAPPPATPSPELAPPGVFYLLTAARVETPDGIRGLPPGTGVKRVREGLYLSAYGEVSLDPTRLTNDMGRARAAMAADRAAQAGMKARATSEKAALAATPTAPPDSKAATAAAHDELYQQEKLISIEIERIRADLDKLQNSNPRTSPTALRLTQRRDQLREQLRKIKEQHALLRR